MTIIGSVLGTIAFIQNITKELTNTNKEKWKKVTEIITLVDYDNLQYQISGRKIRGKTLNSLENIYYIIDKNDQDIIGFKSIFKNKINQKLIELNSLHDQLREYIQVPFWNPYEEKDDNGTVTYGYAFDKNVFFEEKDSTWTSADYKKATDEYVDHLRKAENIAIKMEKTFARIQVLANKDPYELLLPWKWSRK